MIFNWYGYEDKNPKIVKGYKVTVTYTELSPEEQERRRDALAQVFVNSMKKVRT